MENVFVKKAKSNAFLWEKLGDIREGRGDLGVEIPVLVYRLMQYTMLDVLSKACGEEQANAYFRDAGHLAGREFTKNVLQLDVDFNTFVASLQKALKELKIGLLRMETHNAETGAMVLTIGQDLDCSGLPVSDETVCVYDEGFIAGVLEVYTGKPYLVREVDCWASGGRVCRFAAEPR